ncbi:hypothetical protein OPIT5_24745 [Opitutaceae bacterium TAV5]|nr:hypothetical protein OPIT5_24745 [Opitutaceae bacterium TAV5]
MIQIIIQTRKMNMIFLKTHQIFSPCRDIQSNIKMFLLLKR